MKRSEEPGVTMEMLPVLAALRFGGGAGVPSHIGLGDRGNASGLIAGEAGADGVSAPETDSGEGGEKVASPARERLILAGFRFTTFKLPEILRGTELSLRLVRVAPSGASHSEESERVDLFDGLLTGSKVGV